MTTRRGARCRRVLAVALAGAVLTGCGLDLESLPAPAPASGPTYRLTAQFADVQNLTEGAKVKLGGVVIGAVRSISTHDYRAEVTMDVADKFVLGKDARFQIRFTTPLGEDYISITSRGHPDRGRLTAGGLVLMRATSDAPSIEDTFSAVSTLLNGGGLSKLQIIATELDAALNGRTGNARDVLIKLQQVVGNLDAHKDDIDRVLDGLNRMAASLNQGTGVVEQALALLPPALQSVAQDTARVRDLLTRVAKLGDSISGLLRRGQDALLTNFDNLRPTLDSLRARQQDLVPTMKSLIKFGRLIDRAAPGDYLNIGVNIDVLLNDPGERPSPGGATSGEAAPSRSSGAITQLLTGGLK
jgi:phospholipid/cholesterol/gamma-HCH transport system substrate-binding protein